MSEALIQALHKAREALRAPLDGWKGELERAALDKINAALAAHDAQVQPEAQPAGRHKWMPLEPTEAMMRAARDANIYPPRNPDGSVSVTVQNAYIYRSMWLAAAHETEHMCAHAAAAYRQAALDCAAACKSIAGSLSFNQGAPVAGKCADACRAIAECGPQK